MDRPVIQYVVEEAVASGADDILIITGRGKRALEDHFDSSPEFEYPGKVPRGAAPRRPCQTGPDPFRSSARAARTRGRDLPRPSSHRRGAFRVLLGDTINVCEPPLLRQLWTRYEQVRATVLAVEEIPSEKVRDYGVVEGEEEAPGLYRCRRLLEKPDPSRTSSRLGITGALRVHSRDLSGNRGHRARRPRGASDHGCPPGPRDTTGGLCRHLPRRSLRYRRSFPLAEGEP